MNIRGLYEQHRDRLLRLARANGAGDEAEDVLQDVFLSLMERESPPLRVRAWISQAVRYAARRRGKEQRRRVDKDPGESAVPAVQEREAILHERLGWK